MKRSCAPTSRGMLCLRLSLVALVILSAVLTGAPAALAAPQALQTKAIRGINQAVAPEATCTDVSLVAAEDTYLSAADVQYNNGGNTSLHVDATTGTSRRTILLKWDVSSIPSNATVSSASLSLYVTDVSPLVFNLYNMRRSWVEGTSSQANSTTSANWNTYDGVNSWGTVGVASTSADRYDTNLWGAGTTSFSSTGSKTVSLNTDGVAVVQGWIAGTTSNYGLTMQNYSGSTTNAVFFDSSEATTVANRPKLNVTYCVETGPTITTTSSMTAFTSQPGVPSAQQSYTVSGSGLTDNIVITAPADFQISTTSGSGFGSSVILTQSGGNVASKTIYVRFNRATEGSSSGNITHTSTGATAQNVAVSGTASNCTTVNLTAAEDTYLSANDVTYNNGGNVSIHVDNTTGTSRRGALLKWDIAASGIPSNATVSSASITVNVTDASPLVFNLYNMRRTWVEGTSSQAASSTSANWNTYNGAASWGTVGAANTSSDRYDTNLWGASTSSFSSTGSKTETLNSDGVAVVQGWIAGTTSNFGLTMQNYTGSTTNAVFFDSSEATTEANRPKLNVTYCVATGPTITTTGSLSAFSSTPGNPSTAQTYTVAGTNLTDSIYIIAPSGFEISTDGSMYFSSLELEQTDGTVAPTTIHVRLNSATEGTFSGNIAHTSAGATTKNVAASGSVLYVYTLTASSDGHGTVTLSPPGGGYSNGTTVTLTPAPNSGYVFSSWDGANNGDIVSTGGVYTIVVNGNKSVSANFVTGTCTTIHPTAAADTYLSANDVTFNNGGNTQLHVDADTDTNRRTTLLKWDLSTIPSNATVSSASLSLYVEDASPLVFNLYAMRRIWTEGTGNRTASTNSANWNTYDGTNSWGTVGAASTTADRYDTNLWSAGTTSFSTTGSKTEALNAYGMGVVQGWVNGSLSNYGLIMQNYSGSTTNAVYFSSRETTTAGNEPKLNITYCIATTGPTIITTSSLSGFTSNIGVASTAQSYTVAGTHLTDNIVITPPTDFEISLTGNSGWVSNLNSISLTPTSGGTVASTPIYVRFLRATAGTSSGNITHTSSGATQVNVLVNGTASNGAPTVTLVQPADNALGVSYPPALQVMVTDPDANTSSVSFYGRPVGTGTGADFMLALIPDPQNESQYSPAMFNSMTNWIVTNKTTNNIVYVTATGDMVNTSSDTAQYDNAAAAVAILDVGGVPYTMATGNHDIAYGTTYYANYFGASHYASHLFTNGGWFGGSYDDYNTYSLLSAGGMDFILINLQYAPTTADITWADGLLTTYSGRRAIVEQHDLLNVDNSWYNQTSYNTLRSHANLFLMLCGHMHSSGDGAAYLAGTGTDGHTIHVVQADYQDMSNGDGYLRLFRFSPANDMIYMTTYSPYIPGSITSTSNYDQANLAYDMVSSGPYTFIGTVGGVASGSTASIGWTGLSPNTEYEWYAVTNDGTTSTTSATWSFTTGTGTVAVPKPPEATSISISQSSGNVALGWDAVTKDINDNGTTIFRYQVYGSSQDPYFTSSGTLLGEPTATTLSHPAGSTGKTNWYYLVRAVNSAGSSGFSVQRTGWFQFTLAPGS